MLSRKSQASPGSPARAIWAWGSWVLIGSWEMWTRRAYCVGDGLGAKNFDRLGSFQTCQACTGSAVAPAP